MTRSHAILAGPLLLTLLGTAFSVWSALGNDVDFCVTTGCTLYQDFTLWGISLWWYGAAAFLLLLLCAIFGLAGPGRFFSGLFLFGDLCLLVLMSVTAPCVSCLCVALLFVITYFLYRRACQHPRQAQAAPLRPSILIWVWSIFFVINIGQVIHSQFDIWPILDESGEARSRMFFSPSCQHCAEGVNTLSGNINVAFYPVADNDLDVYRLVRMRELLGEGMSLSEALGQSSDIAEPGFLAAFRPDIIMMRLHLLVNRAHVLAAGSSRVPFFEYLGLPPYARADANPSGNRQAAASGGDSFSYTSNDPELPAELVPSTQCGDGVPCGSQ